MAASQQAPTVSQRESIRINHTLLRALRSGDEYQVQEFARENDNRFPGTTPQGNTALHIAARFGNESVVKEILTSEPNFLKETNQNRETPVHIAARMGKIGVIKIFLNTAEQISRSKDIEDNTPLHNAVRNYNRKLAFMLINKDSEPIQYLNKANKSPLCIAIDAKLTHIACLMINKMPSSLDHRGSDGLTLLHRAVINQDYVVMVEILQARRELINMLDTHNRNPLHFAAAMGNFNMVRRLADEDYSLVYQGDRHGLTPVHLAAKNGQIDVLKMLLEFYPDVIELLENKGRNILHVAAENGQADIVKYILALPEMEDLINSPDMDGNTPLHLAAIKFRNYVIYILSTSPRVNIRGTNNEKKTALEIAQASRDHGDMSKLLATEELKSAYASQAPYPDHILEHEPLVEIKDINQGWKIDEVARSLLIMATVIATFTFTAAFTVPGGLKDDGPDKGMATLIGKRGFQTFAIINTMAMTTSMTAAVLVVAYFFYRYKVPRRSMKCIAGAVFATLIGLLSMLLAFVAGFFVLLSYNSIFSMVVCLVGIALPIIVCVVFVGLFDKFFYLLSMDTRLSKFLGIGMPFLAFYHPTFTAFPGETFADIFIRMFTLDRDDRSYWFSCLRFWTKVYWTKLKAAVLTLLSGVLQFCLSLCRHLERDTTTVGCLISGCRHSYDIIKDRWLNI